METLKEQTGFLALVVEDEPAILRLVSVILEDLGFTTVTATDGETGLQLARGSHPDIIITDVRLPGLDGVELCRAVKSSAETSQTPVLLMSAYGEPSTHPGDGFLAKPFDVECFVNLVESYVKTPAE